MLLSQPSVNPAAADNEAIRNAAARGNVSTLRLLLRDARVDPAAAQNAALRAAVGRGSQECFELLMADERVDPSDMGNAALRSAISLSLSSMTERLLQDPRVVRSACDLGLLTMFDAALLGEARTALRSGAWARRWHALVAYEGASATMMWADDEL